MALLNPERVVRLAIAEAVRPPPRVDLLQWAIENVVFGADSPLPGPYDPRSFVYFNEVFKALGPDDPARIVTLLSSAQLGKTEVGNVFVLAYGATGRGTVMVIHPSIEGAARWSRMKLSPRMRLIPSVAAAFPQRARDAADSILFKERKDGLASILISGANSAPSLSQVSAPYLLEDDLAKWEVNSGGDPEAQADSRARAFEFGKIFKCSTPLTYPNCKITRDFELGSQELPFVPCLQCGYAHVLEWSNFHFEQTDAPYFNCPACGGVILEEHRQAMLDRFAWRSQNPAAIKTHRSFWLWSAYSVLQSWQRIAAEWMRAQGDSGAEMTFWTDTLGKAYRPKAEATPPRELAARAASSHYSRGEVPSGALILTLGLDCQLDRVEWQLLGHGEGYRRFVIDVGVIGKHIAEPDCQRNIDLLMQRKWRNFIGREIGVTLTAIDANYSTADVLAYCRKHPSDRLIAVRGVPGDSTPRLTRVRERSERTGNVQAQSRNFFNIGIYSYKSGLYRDLAKTDPSEKGFIAFPRDLPLEFYEQLVSERRVPYKRMGMLAYKWEKPDAQANEGHDTFIYASAAAYKYGVGFISDQGWAQRRVELETPPSFTGGHVVVRERPSIGKTLAQMNQPRPAQPQPPSSEFRVVDRR